MGVHQSKAELLYLEVSYGNIQRIKALRREGAGLEWMDREGKTPLILACMSSRLYNVARTLIQLGANVNVYRQGRNAGTPLHHASIRGLEQTVKLLLSYGANPLVMNDDCQTPLEVARAKGHNNVVRAIEVVHTTFPILTGVPRTPPSVLEDSELAMAISASLQSAAQDVHPHINMFQGSGAEASTSNSADTTMPNNSKMQGDFLPHMGSHSNIQTVSDVGPSFVEPVNENHILVSTPSAPPISEAVIEDGPIQYPSVDISSVDLSSSTVDNIPTMVNGMKEDTSASSTCVVCLDAPVEGVCVPCGHMAGCMSCLKEIKAKNWGCPVCRTKIDQVIRVYSV